MIKAVIFDKDGTLFDFQATWGVWTGQVLEKLFGDTPAVLTAIAHRLKYDLKTGEMGAGSVVIAGTPSDIIEEIRAVVPDLDPDSTLAQLNELASLAPQVEIMPLVQFFQGLREFGVKLAVMTNDAEGPAKAHLSAVLPLLDRVVGSDSGFGAKPDPDPLVAIAAQLGVGASECMMVGDSTHDLIAGRAAGMTCVAVLTGVADEKDLAPFADFVLDDISHIPSLLRTIDVRL